MDLPPGSHQGLYAGTYARAGGFGVYPLARDPDGAWAAGAPFGHALNASYGAFSRRFGLMYLVDEDARGRLSTFRPGPDGWTALSTVGTRGREPCFVALGPEEAVVAVANYGSGSVAVFRLDPHTGLPQDTAILRQNRGGGPDPDRQDGPHAHCARFSPDGRWLYQTDLGTDQILAFPYHPGSGRLGKARVAYSAPPGSGPRHLLFDEKREVAYLVCELASTLTALIVDDGRLWPCLAFSTLPEGFTGKNLGGHIAMNAAATRLYISNRGHDSIATYSIDGVGRLSLLQHEPSGGASPRFFLLREAERELLVVNEQAENIRSLQLDENGLLALDKEELALPGAAFLFEVSGGAA